MNQIAGFFGKYRFLSNFHENPEVPIMIDGLDGSTICCSSVENAYQALKTLNPSDRRVIAESESPRIAKKLGKKVVLRNDWEAVKINEMTALLVQKFTQEPYRQMLLDTGDAELIEDNTWGDTFWGVCNGVGQNNLGILLMKIRKALKG